MPAKRHNHLSYNHLGDTKTRTCLQKTFKKCLLYLHQKLAIITYQSQNILLNKKSEILSNVGTKTNGFSHTSIHSHNPCSTSSKYLKKKLKHRKYHFPPPTITSAAQYMYPLSPSTTTLLSTRLSSSPSCRATSTDNPYPLSPLLPIVHRFWQVLGATSRILTELLYVGSSWSPCFCLAMWGGP